MTDQEKPKRGRLKWVVLSFLLVVLVIAGVLLWPALFPPYAGDPILGVWKEVGDEDVWIFCSDGTIRFELSSETNGENKQASKSTSIEPKGAFCRENESSYRLSAWNVKSRSPSKWWEYPLSWLGVGLSYEMNYGEGVAEFRGEEMVVTPDIDGSSSRQTPINLIRVPNQRP